MTPSFEIRSKRVRTPGRRRHDTLARASRDARWIIIGSLIAMIVSLQIDAFDRVIDFVTRHESWELDELLMAFFVTSVGGFIYAVRRWRDLRAQLEARREAEERVRQLAMHDALTGLANRRKLTAELQRTLARVEDGRGRAALLIADLDRFKPVNDLHGHAIGDAVLIKVAGLLQNLVESDGLAARIGGDEFAVVLEDACEADAIRIASRILSMLDKPIEVDGVSCQMGVSLGVACAPRDGTDAETLLRRADVALYRAKKEGRGRFAFFETGMDEQARLRAELENELRQAVREGRVEPFYHSLVDLSTGEIAGLEVLARWSHSKRGAVPPSIFIPLAEDLGLISDLSLHVLRQACTDALAWPNHLVLAVNISPLQLRDPWLAERVLQVLTETGFPPQRLEVEVTENALVSDYDAAREVIMSLKNQGVRIVLDDFGTGYSSLQHLRELPFDNLKIDRSFVQSYDTDEESRSIVSAILALAHNHHLRVTAEGVETTENCERLRDMGCSIGQGFLYGEPASAQAMNAMFDQQRQDEADAAGDDAQDPAPRAFSAGGR